MKKTYIEVKMWALYNPKIGILSTHATKIDAQNEKEMHGMFIYKIIPCIVSFSV